jgi:hypothetical protein
MPDVPRDAVKRCNEHDVEAMSSSIRHQLVETRPLRFAPRNYACVFVHNFEPALFGHFAEVVKLCFEVLVPGKNPAIQYCTVLHFNSFFLESKYASMARRTNSATGAPVFSDSFWSFFSCCSFKNSAVLLIGIYNTI